MAKNKNKNQEARRRISNILDNTLSKFESEVKAGNVKPTLGDYLKLMQIKQEIDQDDDEAKEIEVRWVDPEVTKPDTSE